MGAMLIVEVIDTYKGFDLISRILSGRHHLVLFFLIHVIGFFLSSILDNLTTIIVLICILKKLIPDAKERLIYSASLVFAVNAGGAWTPIGDVTTTMLWVEEKISTEGVMQALFIPSLLSSAVFATLISLKLPKITVINDRSIRTTNEKGTKRVLFTGLAGLLLAPILKTFLELPPFMSVLLGVAILWIVTDRSISSESEDKQHLRLFSALGRIDISSLLFFFGILLAVDALDILGYLSQLSLFLESTLPSQNFVSIAMGYLSAIIDNVPLVSASIKIYDTLALNHPTWFMIAYCAGVGGSLLIIGSAPGVALMSMEKVSFKWYFKNIFISAVIAYMVGVASLLYLI
jgi:Na+/H+ antiporter NhaD/arsenite permease-like protein